MISLIVISLLCIVGKSLLFTSALPHMEEAFEFPHEEGDEHIVNREVCSKEDLPDAIIDAYDRCTNFIPVYRRLNLLDRCRQKVFQGKLSRNEMRRELCFNHTSEHIFNECMNQIKEEEGRHVPHPNPLQTMDFMFCMKSIAVRRVKKTSLPKAPSSSSSCSCFDETSTGQQDASTQIPS